ncbi:MAG: DegT/DnrJ/EryC1/StrS family aminotransferase [Desulfobacteraceae bacterium]|nr:DegT/DnrJ/EryC1/StrS family aminotransferase [Desulfobacteraceae bacterium]
MIPISQAPIYPQEIQKATSTYLTNHSAGCATFRDEVSNYLICKYVNLTSSGFSGLYAILKACDLTKGDEVIVPAYICEDIPRLVIEMGFKVKFVDIEPYTYNMGPDNLCENISSNTKVVVAAHMFGYPCSIEDIIEISHNHGAMVIEDSCQSMGAEYNGKKVGTFGDAGLFSLNMGKPISTIHGGIVCTNDKELSGKISAINNTFENHGIVHQIKTFAYLIGYSLCNINTFYSIIYKLMGNKNPGETNLTSYYDIRELMYKYTELQAILGVQQLSKLDTYNNIRIKNASYLIDNLDRDDLLFPKISRQMKSTFSRLPVYFENINRENRNELIKAFIRSGIEVTPYLVDSLPYLFKKNSIEYPIAEKMTEKTLTVPTHPNMDKKDLNLIIDILNDYGDL